MMQRVFIDTNLLIYYFSDDAIKSPLAEKLLNDSKYIFVTSTQVLSELLNVLQRKQIRDISQLKGYLAEIKSSFEIVSFDTHDLEIALGIKSKYKLSYYDSLIVTNALTSQCSILYSEDMHHHLKIEKKLTIVNPFK
jgi:predicted nucleic acid-binding protein